MYKNVKKMRIKQIIKQRSNQKYKQSSYRCYITYFLGYVQFKLNKNVKKLEKDVT